MVPNNPAYIGTPYYCNTSTTNSYTGVSSSRSVSCPAGYRLTDVSYPIDPTTLQPLSAFYLNAPYTCIASGPVAANIEVVGLSNIEPGAQLGASAVVTDSVGNPIAGATLHLRVDAVAGSGGHAHGDDTLVARRGVLSEIGPEIVATTPTPANGSFPFTYAAPGVAGSYMIAASCDNRSCTQIGAKSFDVEVDGLMTLPAPNYYALVGTTGSHPDNHYLTQDASLNAMALALFWLHDPYKVGTTDVVLAFNDSSLVWGGTFDIKCAQQAALCWQTPHREHKRGIVIDVRANGAQDSIVPEDFAEFQHLLSVSGMTYLHENVGTLNEHYHVRLLGTKG